MNMCAFIVLNDDTVIMKVDSQKDKKQLKRLSIDMPLRRIQKLCRDQYKL